MRGRCLLILFQIAFLTLVDECIAQQLLELKPTSPVICYESHINNPKHIHPPAEFQDWRRNRTGRTKTANIEVEYINFPADNQAKTAFQFAVDIWEMQITSAVPIRIRAQWVSLQGGVLGQAIWGTAFANFDGAQHLNTFYPVALAEKMAGKELNAANEPDIVATFNSNSSWYFGTNGTPPAGKMDLVTVVLHEIAHGLVFTDTYSVDGTTGSVGFNNGGVDVPFVLDLFVENNLDKKLFSEFPSPSTAMRDQLVSKNLFFDGPSASAANGGTPAKLFAPNPFDAGSSIAHLDEATFNPTANSLMTPQIAFQEAIHNPGSILLGLMSDLGWIYTRIVHAPLKDTERKDGAPYVVKAKIASDNGYSASSVKLHYTTNGTTFTELSMAATGVPHEFQASIPGTTSDATYGYYIAVVDALNREFTKPGKRQIQNQQPQRELIVFNIGPDSTPPEILHSPPTFVFADATQIQLSAIVTDNLGIASVKVEYTIKGVAQTPVTMQPGIKENEYTTTINLPTNKEIGDKIEYRIVATDLAGAPNQKVNPETGYHSIFVTGIMTPRDSYINDFDTPSNDFIGNSFSITKPVGFNNPAIHSAHPYANGSGPASESNYIYQLQIPVRFDVTNPYMQFDEIVLVEPGDPGSVFGDPNFFDYVIVEGSKDLGTSWHALADGYDSRAQSDWLTKYNSSIIGDDSKAVGDPQLFRKRTINLLNTEEFQHGDEVLVRFRLFADQAANGWGWAIDNLSIQGPVTIIEKPLDSTLSVYPTRADKKITVEMGQAFQTPVQMAIINMHGQLLYKEEIAPQASFSREIDVSSFKEGLYVLHVRINGQNCTRKFIRINK